MTKDPLKPSPLGKGDRLRWMRWGILRCAQNDTTFCILHWAFRNGTQAVPYGGDCHAGARDGVVTVPYARNDTEFCILHLGTARRPFPTVEIATPVQGTVWSPSPRRTMTRDFAFCFL